MHDSLRQIETNRRNATKSTGPNTEEGKLRSRRNAIRHGLCAETVVETVEDVDDYRGFEAAVIADYDARTAVERELVLRLASLFWRLRRATAIETDLLRIQAEILRERRYGPPPIVSDLLRSASHSIERTRNIDSDGNHWNLSNDRSCHMSYDVSEQDQSTRNLTLSFQRLANLDTAVFERLGRYESALARQLMKTLFLLKSARVR
jgi:hypothetical protein